MFKKRLLSRSREPMQLSNTIAMTLPDERYRAVIETQKFLAEILNTPRVPKEIKAQARSLLRHYPNAYDMHKAAERCPEVFQEQMEDLHRFIATGVRATADNEAAELTSLQGYKRM
jgi:hypothetical protein